MAGYNWVIDGCEGRILFEEAVVSSSALPRRMLGNVETDHKWTEIPGILDN